MNKIFLCTLSLSSLLILSGCGNSEKDAAAEAQAKADAEAAAAKSDAQHKELKNELANIKSTVEQKSAALEKQTADAKAELSKQLAAQKEELVAKFTASNEELSKQVTGLEKQYDKLAKMIPEDVAKQIDAKLPAIKDSVAKLEQIVANFSPQTMDDINAFSTKYDKELGIAKDLVSQLYDMMKTGDYKLPKF